MATKNLAAIITIGGAVSGSLLSAIGTTKSKLGEVGSAIKQLTDRQKELNNVIRNQEALGRNGSALRVQYARQELEALGRQIALLQRRQAIEDAQAANLTRRGELRGKIGQTMGVAAAVGLPVGAAVAKATEFNYQLQLIGNTAEMSRAEIVKLGEAIIQTSKDTGQSAPDMQRALGFLIAAGMEVGTARDMIGQVGKSATATGGDIEDLAKAAFTLNDSLKIAPGKDMQAALDTLAKAGKEGNVELKDMAKVLPVLGSSFVALKMQGREAAATMGAALEVARKGAGDADEAANNMKNFFAKIMSPETLKKAKKNFNVDLYQIITEAQTKGKNPFEAAMVAIMKATKGDQKAIGELFQDMQVQNFIRPMIQNWEQYQQIKEKALGADGTIDRDFASIMATSKQKLATLQNAFGRLGIAIGASLEASSGDRGASFAEKVDGLAKFVGEHEKLVGATIKVTGAMIGMRLATLGVGYAMTYVRGGILAAQGALLVIRTELAAVAAGTASAQTGFLALATRGIAPLIPMVTALGAAIMATPIGWIAAVVAGLVVGAIAIYKYWEPLKAFFVGFGEGLVAGFAPIADAFHAAFDPMWQVIGPAVMPVLDTIGGWLRSAVGWFGDLLAPISAASETTTAFGNAGKVCGEVVAAAFTIMLKPITLVLDAIKWLNENIGGVIDKVGKAAAYARSFFGGGADPGSISYDANGIPTGVPAEPAASVKPGAAAAAVSSAPAAPPAPPAPSMRGSTAGALAGQAISQQNTFHITQLPGQDSKALAAEVVKEIDRRNAVKRRSIMFDGAGAQ